MLECHHITGRKRRIDRADRALHVSVDRRGLTGGPDHERHRVPRHLRERDIVDRSERRATNVRVVARVADNAHDRRHDHGIRERRESLPDGILARPVLLRERVAHDRDPRTLLHVVAREVSASNYPHSQRREVSIGHDAKPFLMRRITTLRFRLALEDEARRVVVPRRWWRARDSGTRDARNITYTN